MDLAPIISDLSSVVDELEHQMPLLDAKRAGAEMYGAPRLSPFELLNPSENTLSRVVGDLFDPKGSHGQGPLFLNALLVKLGLPRVGVRDFISVGREVLTQQRRRIDLVIETPAVLLGIENKPWAGQQCNQLSDYLRDLKARAGKKRSVLVFLSDQEEKTAKGEVARMPYQAVDEGPSLYAILAETVEKIRADRSRFCVRDFMRYIELHFGGGTMNEEGDEPYIQAVQAEFDAGPGKRKALAAVLLAQSNLHSRIVDDIGDYLLRDIREKVNNDFVAEDKLTLSECLKEQYNHGHSVGHHGRRIAAFA